MYEKDRTIFDFPISGFRFYDGIDVIDELQLGAPVTLKAEPDNPHNPDAVVIYFGETKLGYVPSGDGYLGQQLYFGHGDIFEVKINYRNLEENPERQFRIVVKLKDNRTGGN